MLSASKCSRFSAKSQVIINAQDLTIAQQGGQITEMVKEMEAMKRMLASAGLVPPVADISTDADLGSHLDKNAKKRLPSSQSSPDGKMWELTDDDMEDDED